MSRKNQIIPRVCAVIIGIIIGAMAANASEVKKGEIPADHLDKGLKILPWNVRIWDVDDAVAALKEKEKILWIDTRPESLFNKGSVAGAKVYAYNQSGKEGNDLTREKLEAEISSSAMDKDTAVIVFFCQGPKCHRSYNAAYIAITDWGFKPANIIWFRAGYPLLFKAVKNTPKLKRRAKRYLDSNALNQL